MYDRKRDPSKSKNSKMLWGFFTADPESPSSRIRKTGRIRTNAPLSKISDLIKWFYHFHERSYFLKIVIIREKTIPYVFLTKLIFWPIKWVAQGQDFDLPYPEVTIQKFGYANWNLLKGVCYNVSAKEWISKLVWFSELEFNRKPCRIHSIINLQPNTTEKCMHSHNWCRIVVFLVTALIKMT